MNNPYRELKYYKLYKYFVGYFKIIIVFSLTNPN